MTKIKVAINGFGRIGRNFFRQALESDNIEVVAINDLTDVKTLAHLLKYDSTHGVLTNNVIPSDNKILVDSNEIPVYSCPHPQELPWKALDVDVVLESTGRFLKNEQALQHVIAGAKKVVISAPSPDAKTVVLGVNNEVITDEDFVFSNASCTTNCLAPMAKVINDNFVIITSMFFPTLPIGIDIRIDDLMALFLIPLLLIVRPNFKINRLIISYSVILFLFFCIYTFWLLTSRCSIFSS